MFFSHLSPLKALWFGPLLPVTWVISIGLENRKCDLCPLPNNKGCFWSQSLHVDLCTQCFKDQFNITLLWSRVSPQTQEELVILSPISLYHCICPFLIALVLLNYLYCDFLFWRAWHSSLLWIRRIWSMPGP